MVMKRTFFLFVMLAIISCLSAQDMTQIKLNVPDLNRGEVVMKAFSNRKSTRVFSEKLLSLQDLSDLLWAANGINRPNEKKKTAPSSMNRQDIKIYVCMAEGSYLYNPESSSLDPISQGDVRPLKAPVCLILVSDTDQTWGAIDGGIVSQNISLFCAGIGLATVPRAQMNSAQLKIALKLTGTQTLILNHPVGYFK